MSLSKSLDEQSASARSDRRYTSGQVVAVDSLQHTCTVDVGAQDVQGAPLYLTEVSFQPQSPPSPGDTVTLIYPSRSAHSVVVAGSQLSGQNGQGTITAVGARIGVGVAGRAPVGAEPNLNLIPGTGVTGITAVDRPDSARIDITIDVGSGGISAEGGGNVAVGPESVLNFIGSTGLLPTVVDDPGATPHRIDVTLTNTGVTGLNGFTGAVSLAAGSAIALDTSVAGQIKINALGGGASNWPETTVSGDLTVVSGGPATLICSNGGGPITVSLPSGAGGNNLYAIRRDRVNANAVTVQILSGGTIEGSALLRLGTFNAVYGQQLEAVILQSDGADYKILGALTAYSNLVRPVTAHLIGAGIGTFSWVVPAVVGEIDAPNQRTLFDLTSCSQARLVAAMPAVSAFYSATLAVQYSADGGASWSGLDGGSGPSLTLGGSGVQASGWAPLAVGARADVLLRIVGSGGDGVHGQSFGQISIQVR